MADLFQRLLGSTAPADGEAQLGEDAALRLYLRKRRARLRRGSFSGGSTAAERMNRQRFAVNNTQRLRRRFRKGKRLPALTKEVLSARYRVSPILESLLPERRRLWKSIPKRNNTRNRVSLNVNTFSFLDDPAGTLEVLASIVELEATAIDARINFTFPFCEDIGPFLVLAEMWPSMAPVFAGGSISAPVQKVIEAVGLRRALGMEFQNATGNTDIWAMPVQRRRPAGASQSETRHLDPQRREVVCDMVCDQLDAWLVSAETGCELTDEARAWFKSIIGEILDNAERHSSLDGDGSWTVTAFMARRVHNEEERFACFMAFSSMGQTFAEGLTAERAPHLQAALENYVYEQKVQRRAPQSVETLVTLAALQDGITRDSRAMEDERGGTGLLDIASMVATLASSHKGLESSRIAIISGRSCIRLKHPYLEGVAAGPTEPRRLWCNASNSRKEAPDTSHVFDLPIRLPGTVLSVAF